MDSTPIAGLTSSEARERLARDGANALETEHVGIIERAVRLCFSVISLMLLAAAALSFFSGKRGDAAIIIGLFLINIAIRLWHEHKADEATDKLKAHLSLMVRARRDGSWQDVPSGQLVVGDIVELSVGSVVPADVRLVQATNLATNDSMVTGESLPKERAVGDVLYAGSFIATGKAVADVQATGARTYFGDALSAASAVPKRSALENDIFAIARYLSLFSIAAIVLLSVVFLFMRAPLADILTLDLSLLIAGIPVALPTVMSLIISIGVVELAKRQAVVRRLSALEDLADMTMLLTDKTGTLTENKLHVDAFEVFSLSERDALSYALACTTGESSPLDTAVAEFARGRRAAELPRSGFVPADSERKHSTATVALPEGARTLSLGAPQVVIALCDPSPEERRRFEAFLERAASAGKRVLALSAGEAEAHMRLAALLAFSDPLREDVPRVLSFLQKSGVQVKMLTGDTRIIAADTARRLGFAGEILPREAFDDRAAFPGAFARAAGFAEMLPKDKLLAVEEAKKRYVVAVTGDGVNDVPAVRAADVGIAVRNAVDALRSTADIVLLDNGLRVIGDAVIEARTVFMRLYHYSIFRISESFRVILTIAIIGLLLKTYPLTPIELILLALLNDIPVVSIAFDRVRVPRKPAAIDVKGRFLLSSLLGLTGVGNSLCMLWILLSLQVPWEQVQTVFFLKLVVSGHLLLYVAHTEERWWRFFPSLPVIVSISLTQLLATALAVSGLFVAPLSWPMVLFVWIWSFFWMQVSELAKYALERLRPVRVEAGGSEPAVRPRYTV